MEPLIGKIIESTQEFYLKNKLVDGKLCSPLAFYAPKIRKGWKFRVKDCKQGVVILQNLNSEDWKECELTEEDIADFKVVSRYSI